MPTRAEWLQERRNYIGASDIGKLLLDTNGHPIHPYGSPYTVWLDKMGLTQNDENERSLMGQMLEPIVAKRFQLANVGVKLRATGTHTAKGGQPWHRCNPDRLIVGRVSQVHGTPLVKPDPKGLKAILQIKTAGFFTGQSFGIDGTDQVPDWYLAQVQYELYCTGADLAVLALIYDTHLYRQFLIYRDDALIRHFVSVADEFWTRYVQTKEEPPATSHPKDTEWLNQAWTPKNDGVVIATPEIDAEVDALSRELPRFEKLEAIIAGRKNRIRQAIGENGRLLTSSGEIRWRADKNGRRSLLLSGIKSAAPDQKAS
ncbi:hypothetical protein [Microcystis phage Mae-JY24]